MDMVGKRVEWSSISHYHNWIFYSGISEIYFLYIEVLCFNGYISSVYCHMRSCWLLNHMKCASLFFRYSVFILYNPEVACSLALDFILSLSLSFSSIANHTHQTSSGHLPFLLNLLVTKAVQWDFLSSINRSLKVSLK